MSKNKRRQTPKKDNKNQNIRRGTGKKPAKKKAGSIDNALKKLSQNKKMLRNIRIGIIVIILSLVFGTVFYYSTNKNAYNILVDDKSIGKIKKTKDTDIKEIKEQAILKVESNIGTKISPNEKISYEEVHGKRKEILLPEEIIQKIVDILTYKVEAYIINVDGVDMAILPNEKDVNKVLDSIKDPYIREDINIVETGFVEEVKTVKRFVESDEIIDVDKALQILTTSSEGFENYTIIANDTLSGIAGKAGMTIEELLGINPEYSINTQLKIGDKLALKIDMPILSVKTVEEIVQPAVEPKTVQTLQNPKEPKSYRKSVKYGKDGKADVTYHIIRINGIESGKEEISREITEEPIAEIIEVGTK